MSRSIRIMRVVALVLLALKLWFDIATPPMGIGLYIMVEVAKISFERVTIAVLPLLVPLILALIIITYVPALSLWLPNFVMGPG